MRIVVISEDFCAPWDEGIRNWAWSVAGALERDGHDVRTLNVDRSGVATSEPPLRLPPSRTFAAPAVRRGVRNARAEAILYVASPSTTLGSFVRARVLRALAPRARVGLVGLIPRRHARRRAPLLRRLAPHRTFVGSMRSLVHLRDLGVPSALCGVGVDRERFRPAEPDERRALRRKLGIEEDAFVCLHVGHLRPNRNLDVFMRLAAREGVSAVVVGSTSTPESEAVRRRLEAAGVRVVREVVPVEEYHRAADAYVFPVVHDEGCAELPLSVFEALASGVPVVARPFGGLRDHLEAGDDVRFADDDDAIVAHVDALRERGPGGVRVRPADAFDWSRVARDVLDALAGGDGR